MIQSPIRLPDAPDIAGLHLRMFDPGRDYPAIVDLIAVANTFDQVDYLPSEEGLRNDHEHGGEYDPRRDLLVAEVDGELVAASHTDVRTRDGIGVHHVEGWVGRRGGGAGSVDRCSTGPSAARWRSHSSTAAARNAP